MNEDEKTKKIKMPTVTVDKKKVIKKARKIEVATFRHAHRFLVKRWENVVQVRRHVLTWILLVALFIGATGIQLLWCQNSYKTTAASENSTYVEGVLGPVKTLNPLYATTSAEESASRLLFSSILYYDTSGKLNYDLASNVTIGASGKDYVVKIRSDAKWSDGAALTTADIAFTIGLIQDSSTRSVISGWDGVTVKIIDDTTIEFDLKAPYAAFEDALTFSVLPKHILQNVSPVQLRENGFSQNPVGSGPFKLKFTQTVDSTTGEKIVYMTRNDNYYRGVAKISDFQLHAYPDETAILNALSKNAVNAATDLTPADANQVDKNKYNVSSTSVQGGVYAILNTKSSTLSDVNIRKALQLATDTKAIRDELPSNTQSLDLPFTNNQLSGTLPTVPNYDLVAAKKKLEDAGWKLNKDGVREKNGQTLNLSIVTTKSNEYEYVLKTLSGQWRALGISIETTVIDPSDTTQDMVKDIIQPRNYDVLLYELDMGADPDMYAYWHSSQISSDGLNLANYSNSICDDALASARATLDSSLRNSKYITFAKQWIEDAPAIGLYQKTMQYVSGKNVTAFNKSNTLITSADRYSDVLSWSSDITTVYKTP